MDPEELQLLIRRRAAQKRRITMVERKFNENPSLTTGELESIMETSNDIERKFDEIQTEIEDNNPAELDTEGNSAERIAFENRLMILQSNVRTKLLERKDSNQFQGQAYPRLPEIPIPTFDGTREGWIEYKQSFRELIGDRDINPAQKFGYLKATCQNQALKIVSSVTNSDYQTAWSKLEEEFENDTQLTLDLVNKLYGISSPIVDDSKSLQNFVNQIQSSITSLSIIQAYQPAMDLFLVVHLSKKLDIKLQQELEAKRKPTELYTLHTFLDFLKTKIRILESTSAIQESPFKPKSTSTPYVKDSNKPKAAFSQKARTFKATPQSYKKPCVFCEDLHPAFLCPTFKSFTITQRKHKIKQLDLCSNCLRKSHGECTRGACKECQQYHHTLIHEPQVSSNSTTAPAASKSESTSAKQHTTMTAVSQFKSVVLATALVFLRTATGQLVPATAFLDSGSTVSFIRQDLAQQLGIKFERVDISIGGINSNLVYKHQISATMTARIGNYETELDLLVSRRITDDLPVSKIDCSNLNLPPSQELADPQFHQPKRIDLLLGCDVFFDVLLDNKRKLTESLWAYPSKLGTLIAGKVTHSRHPQALVAIEDLKIAVQKFWEIENVDSKAAHTIDEKRAEEHFKQNVRQRSDGHYEVPLPFNNKIDDLGHTRDKARSLFLSAERKRQTDPEKCKQYADFMNEMLTMNHMELCESDADEKSYHIPHHIIWKPSSITTRYRVVFNASYRSSSGLSLNDCLLVGPTIQDDVFTHLIHWRQHAVALTADITKMYRMIYIIALHRDFQRIWWRSSPEEALKEYRLCTVTYGTASAPFQATRTLKQLAMDQLDTSDVASMFDDSFYIDDLIKSFIDQQTASKAKDQLNVVAAKGGFQLRKWSSNIPSLDDEYTESEPVSSVLGVTWNRKHDKIIVSFENIKRHIQVTKASILSEIAQLFDPLGLVSPLVLKQKLFVQQLWSINLDWDDQIEGNLLNKWNSFREELMTASFEVNRCIFPFPAEHYSLHGFADASNDGYGAVVYAVSNNFSHLVCSKSRVSPLKPTTTPRLELCAAVLLAKLMKKVRNSLEFHEFDVHLWSDSEITIYRIKTEANRFTTFVGTRVAEIQELSLASQWKHVPTALNPADLISRGTTPNELKTSEIWWSGPKFLIESPENWPDQSKFNRFTNKEETEYKKAAISCSAINQSFTDLFKRFSSMKKLVNCVAFLIRFMLNSRKPQLFRNFHPLSLQETSDSELRIFRALQNTFFHEEIQCLMKRKPVSKSSKLYHLNPFIDDDSLIRVGGRLRTVDIPFDAQHQIILPKHHVTKLILEEIHVKNLHCGSLTLLGSSRQRFWILGARSTARAIVHNCLVCFRQRPRLLNQLMADIQHDRMSDDRAFSTVGIDFCGPFSLKHMIRSKTTSKVYVCLFTCFQSRATHLEIVHSLTTDGFLNALRRFISRRGIPGKIYSDNATNFVGGHTKLQDLHQLFTSQNHDQQVLEFCNTHRIQWIRIPPRSPHWGGLWESMIKVFKSHFKRLAGDLLLNIEEMETLVAQCEAVMNSRPLTPVSDDANDYECITPGHFIIFQPLNLLPEPNWEAVPSNRLKVWQRIQQVLSLIWKRFYNEYLHELQRRAKWVQTQDNVQLNTIVLIHQDDLPPTQWKLGRIAELHRGRDGHVRMVTLRTANGLIYRAITKVAPLPIDLS